MNEDFTAVFEVPDQSYTDLRPIPLRVAADMRTLECPPPGRSDEVLDLDTFVERAHGVLREIRRALSDDLGRKDGITALGVSENRNTVTGARGLILRSFWHRGRYSGPLGEIFSPTGLLDQQGKDNFDTFRELIWRRRLELWIHAVRATHYIGFAIFRENAKTDHFCYGARLLVTPFEIRQWRNAFVEADGGRPS